MQTNRELGKTKLYMKWNIKPHLLSLQMVIWQIKSIHRHCDLKYYRWVEFILICKRWQQEGEINRNKLQWKFAWRRGVLINNQPANCFLTSLTLGFQWSQPNHISIWVPSIMLLQWTAHQTNGSHQSRSSYAIISRPLKGNSGPLLDGVDFAPGLSFLLSLPCLLRGISGRRSLEDDRRWSLPEVAPTPNLHWGRGSFAQDTPTCFHSTRSKNPKLHVQRALDEQVSTSHPPHLDRK